MNTATRWSEDLSSGSGLLFPPLVLQEAELADFASLMSNPCFSGFSSDVKSLITVICGDR